MENENRIKKVISEVIPLAKEYRKLTGKPLGITGEVGEVLAAEKFHLKLTEARQPGYDAIRLLDDGTEQKVQIKSRCIFNNNSQRMGAIKKEHDFDTVMLVIMNGDYEIISVHEAAREKVMNELERPGSKARNEKGALNVGSFKKISNQLYP